MSNKPTYTVLWETDTPFKNQYSIELNDSIDNYDEIICYGSANRGGNDRVNVKSTYPVISGTINLVGPYTLNTWQSTNYYMLNNGTQMYLSGTSGYIDVSYYWGMQNGGTAFEANRYTTARNADVHPYKIVGVKHGNSDKIWETTGNAYETNITLDEPITHFNKLLIYSSGTENSAYGVHLAKNVYTVQPSLINGCDTWGYSPWALNFKCNYLLGCSLKLSGNSGHVGSSYYWGIGNNNATWAAGRWNSDYALSALQPYKIVGVDHKPILNLNLINGEHGTISADTSTGCEYDYVNLEATPNEGWYFSGYSISGAQLTGNQFRFNNSDVTVEGGWTDQGYPITYETTVGGSCTGDTTIYIPGGTGITLQTAYNTYYRLSGYEVTGGTINGNVLTPTGPCTARAVYKVNYFTARGKFNQVVRGSENWGRNGTGQAYAYAYYTGGTNCPNSYYASTYTSNNRGTTNSKASGWNPTGSISGYSFTGTSTSYAYIEDTTRFGGGIARLQVNNSNFGAGAWPNTKGNPTCTATGSTTTKGPVRYYLSGKTKQGYQVILSCLAKTGNNGWTATGIAP